MLKDKTNFNPNALCTPEASASCYKPPSARAIALSSLPMTGISYYAVPSTYFFFLDSETITNPFRGSNPVPSTCVYICMCCICMKMHLLTLHFELFINFHFDSFFLFFLLYSQPAPGPVMLSPQPVQPPIAINNKAKSMR